MDIQYGSPSSAHLSPLNGAKTRNLSLGCPIGGERGRAIRLSDMLVYSLLRPRLLLVTGVDENFTVKCIPNFDEREPRLLFLALAVSLGS